MKRIIYKHKGFKLEDSPLLVEILKLQEYMKPRIEKYIRKTLQDEAEKIDMEMGI